MADDQWPIMSDRCPAVRCAPERQAGPASGDSCSKIQMLNAKCSVLNALRPRYPRRRFTPCARGRVLAASVDLKAKEDHRFHGLKRIRGGNFQRTTSPGAPGNNGEWGICFVGTAGICDGELDRSVDLADGAGNGSVRKPRIRAMKSLQNLSQALCEQSHDSFPIGD